MSQIGFLGTLLTGPTGPQGPIGPPGEELPLTVHVSSPSFAAGRAVTQTNGQITLANTAALATVLMPTGIAIEAGSAGLQVKVITQGVVDPAVINLGAGVACAVGVDANGKPVRVTDPTCESGLKYLGVCDVNGAIYAQPRNEQRYRAVDHGLKANGTDDHAALSSVFAAAADGGEIELPPNATVTLGTELIIDSENVVFRGGGKSTILKANVATMFTCTGACKSLEVRDMTVDGNYAGVIAEIIFAINANYVDSVTFVDVDFVNLGKQVIAVSLQYGNRVRFVRCTFDGSGQVAASACNVLGGFSEVLLENCRFRGMYQGLLLAPGTTEIAFQNFRVINCDFDMMYYSAPALSQWVGSGGTVTYTGTTLVDSTKTFVMGAPSSIRQLAQYGYVRAMPVRATGTLTSQRTQVIDASAHFLSDGIIPGEIVRTSTCYAIVRSVESDTLINIEEWLDNTTATPVASPENVTYTVFGILLGKIEAVSSHTVSLYDPLGTGAAWADLNGTPTNPTNGDRYEVVPVPNYPIQTNAPVQIATITGNVIRRSYTDCISVFGDQACVAHNTCIDSQDEGVTVNASTGSAKGLQLVHDNRFIRQGTGAVFSSSQDTVIHDNVCFGWGCRATPGSGAPMIGVFRGTRVDVHHNKGNGTGFVQSTRGIDFDDCIDCSIADNLFNGDHITVDISFQDTDNGDGSGTHGNSVSHGNDSIEYLNSVPGQRLSVYGASSPASRLAAAIGSLFVDSTNGHLYFKASGTDSSGWSTVI